ncbi:MAG: WXG100 family type VII secretion target [Microthrixaceae bacterium]
MPAIGGEIDQLTTLKSTFDRESGNVAELTSTIRSQLGNTYWVGPAAERFRSAWQGEFEPMLNKLQQALNEAGAEVAGRRDALVQAGS